MSECVPGTGQQATVLRSPPRDDRWERSGTEWMGMFPTGNELQAGRTAETMGSRSLFVPLVDHVEQSAGG